MVGGEGTRRQNYVDVRDIAEAALHLLTVPSEGVYHVGGAKSVSNLELAQACVSVLGSESEVSCDGKEDPQEGLAWEVSSGRATEAFGYVAAHAIEDSIEALAEEYRAQGH